MDKTRNKIGEWVKAVWLLIQIRIEKSRRSVSTKPTYVLKDHKVAETLSTIHDKYVVVPADKALNNRHNNSVLVCKKHYIDCLKIELGLDSSQGNPTYTATTLSKEEIIDNHKSVLSSFWSFLQSSELNM